MSENENINFIPANELPVAEGDEVSVLCLENGEMKQKPGASLGGGEKADLVLKLTAPFHYGSMTADKCAVTIESGSVGDVVAAMEAGRPPVVKVHRFYDTGASEGWDIPNREGGVYDCSVLHYGDYIHFNFVIPGPEANIVKISMATDDPEYLEVWRYPVVVTTIQVK